MPLSALPHAALSATNSTHTEPGRPKKEYVVETNTKVIERCLLMTTDPGDLVLDPTCGSGTTAYVAEQWGRRWITCDTSRVALALARQRLMTARFAFYQLRPLNTDDLQRNPRGTWLSDTTGKHPGKCTFQCKTVPHITLKSIARNTSLDPIFAKHEPILAERLAALNRALAESATTELRQKLAYKLAEKQKREGKKAVTDADRRRWLLPELSARVPASAGSLPLASARGSAPAAEARRTLPPEDGTPTPANAAPGWREWEVPFDTDPDWPQPLQEALLAYRQAWRAKMDEVTDCIAKSAEMEELVDRPEIVNRVVRVAGPFTMEGVIAVEDGPDTPIGGAPDGELETFANEPETANSEAHLDKVLRLLRASGVDFPGGKSMKLARLEPVTGASLVHAEGEWANGDQTERRVAVSVGPAVGNLSAYQVEEVVRAANRKSYDDVVFAGFGFDAAAQDAIEQNSHPHLRLHMALIRPDVAMGDLLKTQPGSQIFTVFSAPRVTKPEEQRDGLYVIEVEGMDVYDPVSNTLFPTDERTRRLRLRAGRPRCLLPVDAPSDDRVRDRQRDRPLADRGRAPGQGEAPATGAQRAFPAGAAAGAGIHADAGRVQRPAPLRGGATDLYAEDRVAAGGCGATGRRGWRDAVGSPAQPVPTHRDHGRRALQDGQAGAGHRQEPHQPDRLRYGLLGTGCRLPVGGVAAGRLLRTQRPTGALYPLRVVWRSPLVRAGLPGAAREQHDPDPRSQGPTP
jgi:adenine-specific DNA-methyltransferase